MISSPGWAGQAVEDDRAVGRAGASSVVVDLVRRELGAPRLGLVLVAHADPDVGVDGVGAGGRLARVVVSSAAPAPGSSR